MVGFTKKASVAILLALVLGGCSSKWNTKVDLPADEVKSIQAEIQEAKKAIKEYEPKNGEIPINSIVTVAKDLEKLGKLGDAIDFYGDWLEKGTQSKTIIHNVGRLYEQVGEVDLAVEQYQRIIDEYLDSDYLYDITWAYINAAQKAEGEQITEYRKLAEKYFNAWQLDKKKTDEQTQQAIKAIRAKEQAKGK